jgi:CheY-like chemotaxis protein
MIERAAFVRGVHDLFAHLDDPSYMASHAGAAALLGVEPPASAAAIRRAALAVIAETRPPDGTPHDTAVWRRWRCLWLWYGEGLTSQQIALQLQVSVRQVQRDHLGGVDAVAAILWARHGPRNGEDGVSGALAPAEPPAGAEQPARYHEDLGAALARASVPADAAPTSLVEVLRSALDTLHRLLDERAAQVQITAPDEPCVVAVDRAALRHMLLCLLGAAATWRHAPRLDIAVGTTGGDARLRVQVAAGEPPTTATRPASSHDSASLLDAARRLAELAGGTLQVEGGLPAPTGATLSLPASRLTTVLVIDDNPDVAELFRAYLAGQPYRLVQARTAPGALRLARELRPDVITLDVLMPTEDGWQILQHLRASAALAEVPVVVCSVIPEQPLAASLGADGFLAKPVTAQSLESALRQALASRRPATAPGSPADSSPLPPR